MTVSAMSQRGSMCWALALLGMDSLKLAIVFTHPYQALAMLAFFVCSIFVGNIAATMGAMRCPAAVSATLMTASTMGAGYAAQVLVFDRPPTLPAGLGATMMLLSVVIMA